MKSIQKYRNPAAYFGFGTLIVLSTSIWIIVFPQPLMGMSDDLTAIFFFVGFLLGGWRWFRIGNWRARWFFGLLPVISLLGLLDEISYGIELFGFQRPIWQRENVAIGDLHSLMSVVIDLVRNYFRDSNFDRNLLSHYSLIDGFIAGFVILIIFWLRYLKNSGLGEKRKMLVPKMFIGSNLVFGLGTLIWLLSIPGDPKNAWLLGFSPTRIITILGILLFISGWVILGRIYWYQTSWGKKVREGIDRLLNSKSGKIFIWITILIVFSLVYYQIYLVFNPLPDLLLSRLDPVLFLAVAVGSISLVSVIGWQGGFTRPFQDYLNIIRKFFRDYPAWIFGFYAIVLVVFAQILDKYLPFPKDLVAIDAPFHINWVLEELYELLGGLFMLFGALLIPFREKTNS